jgi:hypothetical protein
MVMKNSMMTTSATSMNDGGIVVSPELRNYQIKGVTDIRARFLEGARRVLYQAPTASGKTVLFSYVTQNAAARANRVAVLGHRQEIVDQIDAALTDLDVPHGVIAAGYPEMPDPPVQVAPVATLVRRLDRLRHLDLLIADEAHRAVAGMWRKIIAVVSEVKVLGVTASPEGLVGSKAKALILDHSGNAYRFGGADAPRAWSLEGRAKTRSRAPVVCRCKECGAPFAAIRCEACGARLREPRPPIQRLEVRSGALVEIDHLVAMSYRQALHWAGESEDRLRLVAKARGYKRGWVFYRLQELRDGGAA